MLEAEASREDDLRGGRDRGLVASGRLRSRRTLLGVEDLRAIDVALSAPEDGDVAPRARDRGARGADPRREPLGQGVVGRELAELGKAGVEEAEGRTADGALIRGEHR